MNDVEHPMNEVLRRTVAVVAAGIGGTLANTVALAMVFSLDRLSLALVPGRYGVAIALCAVLPLLDGSVRRLWFWSIALIWPSVAPSLLARFVFGVDAPWAMLFAFNGIYALAAIFIYRLVSTSSLSDLARRLGVR